MSPLLIGVDSSTQSVKAELRSAETGELIASGRAAHPATSPPISEQHPDDWWAAMAEAIAQLGDARGEAVAMSVAGQQHGLVVVGDDGAVLRPAKLWNDTTSAPQAERLVEILGADWWADWAGIVPVASFTISKLAWLAENERAVFDRVAKVMLPHDWLTWRLTGEHVTDRGDASGTGWYNATSNSVLIEPFSRIGADDPESWVGRVPSVLGPAQAAGPIRPGVAEELGLSVELVVGPGTGDNMAAALGLGLHEGDVVVSLGTSGVVYTRSRSRAHDPSGAVAGFCDATGSFLPLVCTLNATRVTDSVADWLGTDATGLSELALSSGVAPITPTLVPYFDGERTPNRPDARGVIVGLTTATTRADLARAAHDGVICGLLDGMSALQDSGSEIDGRVLLVGGGARSPAYRQRLADISGRDVLVPTDGETVARGAAVQAAVVAGLGDFDSITSAWELGDSTVVSPRPDAHGDEVRARYADASEFDDGLCRPL